MSVHHTDDWLTIHGGDCRDVLATLPDASINCIVTSPPYWGLRDYGVSGQLGLEPTPGEYVANMVAVFREARRVLRDYGTLWLNLGDSYAHSGRGEGGSGIHSTKQTTSRGSYFDGHALDRRSVTDSGLKPKDLVGIPWRVAFALQADGWYLRSDIIWAKPNPMPESVTDRPTKAHEYLFLLTKSPRYWYDADAVREDSTMDRVHLGKRPLSERQKHMQDAGMHGKSDSLRDYTRTARNRRSVWTVATQPYPGAHFAVMPEALVEPCVLAGCPDQTCATCGAPWERILERHGSTSKAVGKSDAKRGAGLATAFSGYADGSKAPTFVTLGWRPTCDHDAPTVPGTVLDPFGGSGTVARVANRLSRRAVLIDLNPEYLEQQMKRNRDMPLGLVETTA